MGGRTKKLEHVADYFRAHPNEWVSAVTLANIGGRLSSRTRVSECRRLLGMRIDNRCPWVVVGGEKFKASEYRYVPDPIPQARPATTLFELSS